MAFRWGVVDRHYMIESCLLSLLLETLYAGSIDDHGEIY